MVAGVAIGWNRLATASHRLWKLELVETAVSTPENQEIHLEAQSYADAMGISLEEASRRLRLQESSGELGATLLPE